MEEKGRVGILESRVAIEIATGMEGPCMGWWSDGGALG